VSQRNFRYPQTREPAIREDGRLFAESIHCRVDKLRVGDIVVVVGTVMGIRKLPEGLYEISGRLLKCVWPADKTVNAVRRNWE
jgi:hypothetical protein